jgi:hypothetical protein
MISVRGGMINACWMKQGFPRPTLFLELFSTSRPIRWNGAENLLLMKCLPVSDADPKENGYFLNRKNFRIFPQNDKTGRLQKGSPRFPTWTASHSSHNV